MKLQIGQTVYLEPTGNAVRYSKEIIETTVTKIGLKYFMLKGQYNKFDLEKMCEVSKYCSDYDVYSSLQEINDKREKEKINKELRELFSGYTTNTLTLTQLRDIQKIINQNDYRMVLPVG